jgi:hypothetical protein
VLSGLISNDFHGLTEENIIANMEIYHLFATKVSGGGELFPDIGA